MGRKKKLLHFAENESFNNLFQLQFEQLQEKEFQLRGHWKTDFFGNQNPLVLELGCGKGEYTVGLAEANPEKNFIGLDIKGARLWRGLKTTQEKGLNNVAFVRTRIELIGHLFGLEEVNEIWITFPDPQPRQARVKKRLTSPSFLDRYRQFLHPDGLIHLKTDSDLLYDYTIETIKDQKHHLVYHTNNLYANAEEMEVKNIRTFYEQQWLNQGLTIKYLVFRLCHA